MTTSSIPLSDDAILSQATTAHAAKTPRGLTGWLPLLARRWRRRRTPGNRVDAGTLSEALRRDIGLEPQPDVDNMRNTHAVKYFAF